jgi:peptidyl-prolyl cis-trans isomerase SurA
MNAFARRLLALGLAAPALAGAQDSSSVKFDIDRIVAVVGKTPILWSEVLEQINIMRARGTPIPQDEEGQVRLARETLNGMIDVEVMVQTALADTSIVVTDIDLQDQVDQRLAQLRQRFQTDAEFNQALRADGFGNIEEYRRWMMDQARRTTLQQRLIQSLRRDGRIIAVAVSEDEITEAFEQERERLPKRPATVTFRQVVVPTIASDAAKAVARAKADSLLREIRDGGNFEMIARRESHDSASAVQGGDLGWNRRGDMVPAFDAMMFFLPPGEVSPLVETQYGYHILRVDRVQPAERKVRHILIKPAYDSSDVQRARLRADSVLALWRAGTNFDTLVARYHDLASDEARGVLEPFERAKLPESYQAAFEGKGEGDFVDPFPVEDRGRGVPKFVVAQLVTSQAEGDYTVQDLRNQIRQQLGEEKSMRRLLDKLRGEMFVSIMLDAPKATSP